MRKLDDLDRLIGRNPRGISIKDIIRKLNVSRSWVYENLRTLRLKGKVYYERGIAYPDDKTTSEIKQVSVNMSPAQEVAVRHFQWRGSPEGGGVRYYKRIFGELKE